MALEIDDYDANGPEFKSNVASISFADPKNPRNSYCVGFRFKGGKLRDPKNWAYDHSHYWTPETLADDSVLAAPVPRREVKLALKGKRENLNTLLQNYLKKLQL